LSVHARYARCYRTSDHSAIRAERVTGLPGILTETPPAEAGAPAWPPYPGAPARIEGRGLSAARGARVLFRGLDLNAEAGRVLELRGANGSGKSTLLRILAGLTQPPSGAVRIDGGAGGASVHALGHLDAVKPNETALQQVRFWAGFLGRPAGVAETSLAAVGLANRASVPGRGLSAGQKRRLALARLLIDPRPVWLLDEPAAALDAAGRAMLDAWVARHLAAGGLVVAAVHGQGFPGADTLDLSQHKPAAGGA
jgi:heme exporter protein A